MIAIYKIKSPTGKVYIGQSSNVELRLRSYRSGNCHKQIKLKASIQKYGWTNHEFSIVHELPNDCEQKIVNEYEQFYMDAYLNAGIELMNLRNAGSNGKHSAESIQKMKGNCGMHMIGRKLSTDAILKRTAKLKGMKRSDESKQRYKQSKIGNKNPMFGKPAHNTILTEGQVIEIRNTPKKYGNFTRLAEKFGVKLCTISAVHHKKLHKQV